VSAGIGARAAREDGGWFDFAGTDLNRYTKHFRQHGLDQIPIDPLCKQKVDVLIADSRIGDATSNS
jgi:hypothetical protein